jgi:hypothetical protein
MSKETPKDHPREKTDWKPYPATDEPWKQNAQKTQNQDGFDTPKPDLEKWQETNTH